MITKVYVTWDEIKQWVDKIVELSTEYNFSGVYGIPRGGLVMATMLSYKLDIPLLTAPHNNCLIVDNISGSPFILSKSANSIILFSSFAFSESLISFSTTV